MTAAEDLDKLLAGPERSIAGFCPTCGGWTMLVTSQSDNARQWIRMSYVAGDLIMPIRNAIVLGTLCPQLDILLGERTCDL